MAREPWQSDLLFLDFWPRLEAINALCGRDLDRDERDYEIRLASGEPWVFPPAMDAEGLRAEKHLLAAFQADELTMRTGSDATVQHPLGTYSVKRDDLIRWVAKQPERFPQFPFTLADMPETSPANNVPGDGDVPWWLLPLLEIWRRAKNGAPQKEVTDLIQTELKVNDLRSAQAIAAFIRPDDLAAQDGRAARRRGSN